MENHQLPFVNGVALNAYLTAENGIARALKTGSTHWYIDGSLETEMPHGFSESRIASLKNQVETLGIRPIYHGNFKAPLASEIELVRRGAVEYVKTEIDLCARLGAPLIIHGGAIVEPRLVKQAKAIALQCYYTSLLELNRYAKEKGVELWLENLSNYTKYRPFHYIFTELSEFKFILEQIPDVKFILDVGHANIGNEDPFEGFAHYHDRIVALSLSNNDGEKDHHFPLPFGNMNFKRLMQLIIDNDWNGLIVFETRGRDPDKSLRDLEQIYLETLSDCVVA